MSEVGLHDYYMTTTCASYMVSFKLTKTPQSISDLCTWIPAQVLKALNVARPCQVGMAVLQTAIWDDPGRFLRSASHRVIQAESLARLAALSTFTVAMMRAQSPKAHVSSKNGLCSEYSAARYTSNRVRDVDPRT